MNKTEPSDNLPHDASKVLENPAHKAAPQIQKLNSGVSETIATATEMIGGVGANAAATLKGAAASTDEFIRDNPWIAIGVTAGIAGAIGFLAGLVAAPKKRFWN